MAQTWYQVKIAIANIQLMGTILHKWSMSSWAWCKEYWMLAWREHETDSFHMTAIINWTWVTLSGRDWSPGNHPSIRCKKSGNMQIAPFLSHDMLSFQFCIISSWVLERSKWCAGQAKPHRMWTCNARETHSLRRPSGERKRTDCPRENGWWWPKRSCSLT